MFREENNAADILMKFALLHPHDSHLLEYPPSELMECKAASMKIV